MAAVMRWTGRHAMPSSSQLLAHPGSSGAPPAVAPDRGSIPGPPASPPSSRLADTHQELDEYWSGLLAGYRGSDTPPAPYAHPANRPPEQAAASPAEPPGTSTVPRVPAPKAATAYEQAEPALHSGDPRNH